jgi:hypothetical protein
VVVEITMYAARTEKHTFRVHFGPESMNHNFRKLKKLEGHQIVFTIKPRTSIREDERLLNLT